MDLSGNDPADAGGGGMPVSTEDAVSRAFDLVAPEGGSGDSGGDQSAKPPSTTAPASPAKPDQPAGATRDPQGRFAGQTEKPAAPAAPAAPAPLDGVPPVAEPAKPVASFRPPASWSVEAQRDFGVLPPHVQEAVARSEEAHSAALQPFQGLEEHAQFAARNGRTLAQEAAVYKHAEEWILRDIDGAFLHMAQQQGVTPQQLTERLTARVASGNVPRVEAMPSAQPPAGASAQPVDVDRLVDQRLAQRDISSRVGAFFGDPANKYAGLLRNEIAELIEGGHAGSLPEAYAKACERNPIVKGLVERDKGDEAAAAGRASAASVAAATSSVERARAAARSLPPGSPTSGVTTTVKPPKTAEDAVSAAFAAHGT